MAGHPRTSAPAPRYHCRYPSCTGQWRCPENLGGFVSASNLPTGPSRSLPKLTLEQRTRAYKLEDQVVDDSLGAAYEIIALRDAAQAMADFAFSHVEQTRGYRAAIRAFC